LSTIDIDHLFPKECVGYYKKPETRLFLNYILKLFEAYTDFHHFENQISKESAPLYIPVVIVRNSKFQIKRRERFVLFS
jgi:hypothetical protein